MYPLQFGHRQLPHDAVCNVNRHTNATTKVLQFSHTAKKIQYFSLVACVFSKKLVILHPFFECSHSTPENNFREFIHT